MTTAKEWLNANVWANGAIKEDLIDQQELLQIVTNCIAATQARWVSVDERLPEDGERVVFKHNRSSDIGCGVFATSCNVFFTLDNLYFSNNISHWMPLPTPPEAKS